MENNLLKVSKKKMKVNGVLIGGFISLVYLIYEFTLSNTNGELESILYPFSALIIMLIFSILLGRKYITKVANSSVTYKSALKDVFIMCLVALVIFICFSTVIACIYNLTGRISVLLRTEFGITYESLYQKEFKLTQLFMIMFMHSIIGGISALLTIFVAPLFIKCKKK